MSKQELTDEELAARFKRLTRPLPRLRSPRARIWVWLTYRLGMNEFVNWEQMSRLRWMQDAEEGR